MAPGLGGDNKGGYERETEETEDSDGHVEAEEAGRGSGDGRFTTNGQEGGLVTSVHHAVRCYI